MEGGREAEGRQGRKEGDRGRHGEVGGLASRLSSFTLGKLYNPLVQVRVGVQSTG